MTRKEYEDEVVGFIMSIGEKSSDEARSIAYDYEEQVAEGYDEDLSPKKVAEAILNDQV